MVSKPLKKAIQSRAHGENVTMSDIYHRALRAFVSQVEDVAARGQLGTVAFLATYKAPNVLVLQMLVDSGLIAQIDRFIKRAHVTRATFCYTALRAAFPND